jgi:hypothetical protein
MPTLGEAATEEEYQTWLAHPDTPPLHELQWAHNVVDSELPFCGCGDPDECWDWLRALLALMACGSNGQAVVDYLGGYNAPNQLLLGVLDKAGLAEHGTGIYGGWLTDKGQRLLAVMCAVNYDDLRYVGYPGTDQPNPGLYELVQYGGAWIVRETATKQMLYQGDAEGAEIMLAAMNGRPV